MGLIRLALVLYSFMVAHSCMPKSVEHRLEVHEDMVKVWLVLQVFLTEYSKIENLLSCAPSCSEACLFFIDDLLSLWLQSVQEDS